jgi:hypothetical protein
VAAKSLGKQHAHAASLQNPALPYDGIETIMQ